MASRCAQLAAALGRGIERDRIVDPVIDRERLLLVGAIDRGRARIDETAQPLEPARRFEHHDLSHHVRAHIDVGIDQRIAHACLGREVDDPGDLGMARDDAGHRVLVGDVDLVKLEPPRAVKLRQPARA